MVRPRGGRTIASPPLNTPLAEIHCATRKTPCSPTLHLRQHQHQLLCRLLLALADVLVHFISVYS